MIAFHDRLSNACMTLNFLTIPTPPHSLCPESHAELDLDGYADRDLARLRTALLLDICFAKRRQPQPLPRPDEGKGGRTNLAILTLPRMQTEFSTAAIIL